MNSKRYQRLALAVALGVGVSAAALPHGFAAEEGAAPVLSDSISATEETMTETPVADAPVLTTTSVPTSSDERAAAWAAKRPAEDEISRYLAAQVGKTIMEIKFSGATEATEPTARAALAMHVGDAMTEEGLVKDRAARPSTRGSLI